MCGVLHLLDDGVSLILWGFKLIRAITASAGMQSAIGECRHSIVRAGYNCQLQHSRNGARLHCREQIDR